MGKKRKRRYILIPQLEFPGPRYPGRRSVSEIFKEIERQAQAYQDYVVATKNIVMRPDDEHGIVLEFSIGGSVKALPMSAGSYMQLAQWLGIPTTSRLYQRFRWGYSDLTKRKVGQHSTRFWQPWCDLVNAHFRIIGVRKLVRTLKTQDDAWYIRAVLSDRYRIIPNGHLFMAVADKIRKIGAEVWDARLSEDRLYIYCVASGINAQVRKDRTFESDQRWIGDAGDVVNAAITISNSETGHGGCEVSPAIVTKVTGAYVVRQNAVSMRHVGTRHEMDAMLSDRTIKRENRLIFSKITDIVDSTFDPDKFQIFVDRLDEATQDEVEDPVQAAKALQVVYDLSEQRKDNIIGWLMRSGDRSRYGLAVAVAREAHDNQKLGADEAARLEQTAADIVERQTALKLARAYRDKETKKAMKDAETADNAAPVGITALDE